MPSRGKKTWVDYVADAAARLGFNRVQVYWKLKRWTDSTANRTQATKDTVKHVGYEHKRCPNCGALQHRENKVCDYCGKKLLPRFLEVLSRIGLVTPHFNSVTTILLIALIGCYVRSVFGARDFGLLSVDVETLVRFGGNFPRMTLSGDWWRLGTAIFLHGGLWHILFNAFALQEIGPRIESVFGRGKFLLFFLLTGVLASLGSLVWHEFIAHRNVVSIGASGAIMGLVGIAAGWGHRVGTTMGKDTRDLMLKWGAYTVVFGFLIGADNAAHISGLMVGGLIGLFVRPASGLRSSTTHLILALIGVLLFIITVLLVLFPPGLVK